MPSRSPTLLALALLPLGAVTSAAQQTGAKIQICLAPASTEMASGNNAEAVAAVGETFAGFLSGPTLGARHLSARLESQAREEARQAGCPYVLFTSLKHERKTRGGGLLGAIAGGAAQQGAWSVGAAAGSGMGQIAAGAAAGAVGAAASDLATSTEMKDELELTYRLESGEGKRILENEAKRKAKADGEDLLTPLAERAAEAIAAAVHRGGR